MIYGANIIKNIKIENPYWKDVFETWAKFCKRINMTPANIDDVLAEPLWLNTNFRNPSHIIKHWANNGLLTIGDLCDENGFQDQIGRAHV